MEENKSGKPHTEYAREHGHDRRPPYWQRAHHDWKFWVAIVLMLCAMALYLKTNDLSLRPHTTPQLTTP